MIGSRSRSVSPTITKAEPTKKENVPAYKSEDFPAAPKEEFKSVPTTESAAEDLREPSSEEEPLIAT